MSLFEFTLKTTQRNELINITDKVYKAIQESGISEGLCTIFCPHTTAGITINENADPDVKRDVINHLKELIPVNNNFSHLEGNSDAHIKSSLVGPSLTVIVSNNKPLLGTWQGILFAEFDGPRQRKFYVKCIKG